MGIVRVNPFRAMDMMTREFNKAFNTFDGTSHCVSANFSPRIDISEDENKIYMSVEVPGIPKEDVNLTINDENLLIIKGEKKTDCKTEDAKIVEEGAEAEAKSDETEAPKKDKTYIRTERSYGTFSRSFVLPDNIVNESVKANYNNGVLDITIDKKEPEKPKEISVNIN